MNRTTGCVVARQVVIARSWRARLVGWIGRKPLPSDVVLGIPGCDWVHTFFVSGSLDLVFCDRDDRVLRVVAGLMPGRFSPRVPGAFWTWEMRAGQLASVVSVGDTLAVEVLQ